MERKQRKAQICPHYDTATNCLFKQLALVFMSGEPSVSIEQAQAVVDKHFTDNDLPATIVNFTQVAQGFR
jgi:hypothetical protein